MRLVAYDPDWSRRFADDAFCWSACSRAGNPAASLRRGPAGVTEPRLDLRVATAADTPAVVALYDEAVEWLAARGRTDQWGTTPFSGRPEVVEMIRARAASGTMWLAHTRARILGAIVLGDGPPSYLDRAADQREIYLSGFITSRAPDARAAGRLLLRHARATAGTAGVSLLRLDCYAGGDGALVRYYESVGFEQVTRFSVELLGATYTGCLLEQRLSRTLEQAHAVADQDRRVEVADEGDIPHRG